MLHYVNVKLKAVYNLMLQHVAFGESTHVVTWGISRREAENK
jgi:hypothetical protein